MKTLIIAEAGVNHNGDLNMARALVDAAAEAGADLVKFQTFSADRLVTTSARKADYQIKATEADESQYEMIRRLELSPAMHADLIGHCQQRGIEFFSTAFDLDSLDYLNSLGMPRIKVPSGEITNLPYLRKVGAFGKHVILSTGMSTLGEIEAAVDVLERAGTSRDRITVLHCNTEYPVPMAEVNLRAMISIREAFGVEVGFSDHTEGIEVAVAAVALGACVIEKHFTLDRSLPGPDHRASIEPQELAHLIRSIRNIELAMGDGVKRPGLRESQNIPVVRKSLVAVKQIHAGELFSAENVGVKRPGTGLNPMRWDEVIGRRSARDFSVNELIEL
ncbi:N-acetylneuraminate synthase [Parazoarcus communis]|uniref:N-acetylneuraminate synthase n=1 Tax=Parazoarcus communis TaxID=41977 RepID=A0A2U8H1Y7_9RHOO|nr:N-acetylneuraminate synthase [Parazoarcus communis]AWI79962.1 N-acetylneuraminate synthase [Parazoarcus communis]